MKKTRTNVTAPTPSETALAVPLTQEEITRRAYELWLLDGCPTGRAIYHWHEAERQLLKDKPASPPTNTASSIPNDRSITSMIDDSSPYNALEEEAPLSVKVERSLAKTNIKSAPSSGGSVNLG